MNKIGKNDKKPPVEKNNKKPSDISGNLKDSVKEVFMSKGFVSFIFAAIILLLLILCIYFIFDDEGNWKDYELGKPSTYTNNVKLSTTEGIKVDINPLIKENLLLMGYTQEEISNLTEADIIRIFKMSEKLGRTINSLGDCSEIELLWCISDEYAKYLENPEQLEFLINAEIVTQYPKLNLSNSDLLDGIIEFKRTNIDPDTFATTEVMLQYISSAEFDTKYQNYINTGNRDVFNYFTIDDEENVIIATWTQENGDFSSNNVVRQDINKIDPGFDEQRIKNEYDQRYVVNTATESLITAQYASYSITTTKVNYKSLVQQYTMPFEYLWALLVMGESYDFVEGLAQLAYDSEITIGIFDSLTTTVTVDRKEYTEEFRERFEIHEREKAEEGETQNAWELVDSNDWQEESYPYYAENKVTIKYNSTQVDLIYADTWIVEMAVTYQRADSSESPFNNTNNIEDEEWSDNGSYEEYDERTEIKPASKPTFNYVAGEIISTTQNEENIIEIKRNYYKEKKTTGQANTSTQTISYNKYQKMPATVKEKTDPNADKNNFVKLLRNDEKAYGLLTNSGVMVWLIDVLEQNQSTVSMVDLTVYLINKAKDPDNTELTFDFSIFDPANFNSITGMFGNTIQEKVWFALKNIGYSDIAVAGAMGNIHHESGGFNVAAVEKGSEAGIGLIQWTGGRRTSLEAYAASKGVSWQDEDTQIEFLVTEITGQGKAVGYATQRVYGYIISEEIISTHDEWADADTVENSTLYFMRFFESPADTSSLSTRQSYANMYLQQFEGKTMLAGGSESIVQSAIEVHEYVRTNGYYYEQAGIYVPNYSTKTIDCSSYVSWVLLNANVPEFTAGMYQATSVTFNANPWGFQEVSINEAAPGDIVVYSGHVEIVANNNLNSNKFVVYNCGGKSSIESSGTTALPESSTSSYKKSDATKILRINL